MNLDDIFSPEGPFGSKLENYRYRSSQVDMAHLIDEGFKSQKHIVVEAGTGTGKSFAYLVPSFLMVSNDKSKKVVIATSTTTLQKQLYEKDIPVVEKTLGLDDIKTAILFGRSNYICMRKYQDVYEERKLLTLDQDSPESILDTWIQETDSGAMQDAPQRISILLKDLRCDDKDCMGKKCHCRDKCFFFSARRKAQRASIIVTNHHIVLFDARYRYENDEDFSTDCILPGYTHAVIDEAHHIEDEATDILSSSFSSAIALSILDDLTKKQARFSNMSILRFLSVYEKDDKKGISRRLEGDIAHLRTMLESFDSSLNAILSSSFNDKSILFTREFYNKKRSDISFGEAIAESLLSIALSLGSSYIESEDEIALDLIKKYSTSLKSLSDTLRSWMRFDDFDSYIPFAQEDTRNGNYTIKISPMSTGPILERVLLSNLESLLYCSATLTVNNSFAFFSSYSGLSGLKPLEGIFPSPFDYAHSLMVLVPIDGMDFNKQFSDKYNKYASMATADAIKSSCGGALVLFTANEMLKVVCKMVRDELGPEMHILSQCDGKVHKAVLLNQFRNDENSSLFATDSFWEGVDAPGNTLRMVVIEKLPFSVPTDPIERARSNFLDSKKEGSSFMMLTVPKASIKLKQGIGRLIRKEGDRGVVLILDKRILSKGYGKMMLRSIPEGYMPEDTLLSNIANKIERFLF